MAELTKADRYLLDRVRRGEQEGWSQLVDRYQGRLLAFARSRAGRAVDADDLVQETFIAFLRSLAGFRGQASIETYLFTILRRRIIDLLRHKRLNVCLIQDQMGGAGDGGLGEIPAADATASWYLRRDEQNALQREALGRALRDLIKRFRDTLNFRDLEVVELLFYCQLRNRDVARIAGVTETQVAAIKHRSLRRIRQAVAGDPSDGSDLPREDSLLTEIWEAQRLSCPKRSTIGAYLLGTLDRPWEDYVRFHLDELGCRFCQANLTDLRRQTAGPKRSTLYTRIMESTIGFLRKT